MAAREDDRRGGRGVIRRRSARAACFAIGLRLRLSAYEEETRHLATQAKASAELASSTGMYLAAGLAVTPGGDKSSAFTVFVAAGFQLIASACDRIAGDPARKDYDLPSSPVQPDLFNKLRIAEPPGGGGPQGWAALSAFGGYRFARSAWDFGRAAASTAAELEASVLAFERWQGAVAEGAEDAAVARQHEAERFAHDGGASLIVAADHVRFLSRSPLLRRDGSFGDSPYPVNADREILASAGLDMEDVRDLAELAVSSGTEPRSSALQLGERAARDLGRHLSEWRVPDRDLALGR